MTTKFYDEPELTRRKYYSQLLEGVENLSTVQKGRKEGLKNYNPVSLLCQVNKVFARVD